jgi:hypothetical protein
MRLSLASDKWNSADEGERVTVSIEGVDDHALAAEIESAIRAVVREAHLSGRWNVALAPSDLRGRWDVVVKGPARRHVFSFLAGHAQVTRVIGGHVRRAIERMRPVP